MLRLFVAVDIPAPVRAALIEVRRGLQDTAPVLRWVDPSRWHLTLVFLGWVDDELSPAVEAAVGDACAPHSVFELALDGTLGTFRSGVLWAGLEESQQLAVLAESVTAALRPVAALPDDDRPFHAHLTLARAPRGKRIPRGLADAARVPPLRWRVERVALMRSELRRDGARYHERASWPLGGSSSSS